MKIDPQKQTMKWEGKIRCDCPCPGPYCTDLIHPCSKPKEHYLQSRDAEIAIRYDERQSVLREVEEKVIGEDENEKDPPDKLFNDFEKMDNKIRNDLRANQRQKLSSLRESR